MWKGHLGRLQDLFNIRTSLWTVTSLLVGAVVVITAIKALTAWQDLDNASTIRSNNSVSDLLLTSAGNWAVERGVTAAALATTEPVSSNRRSIIDERRERADAAFDEAMTRLADGPDFRGKDKLVREVRANHDAAVSFRRRADTALTKRAVARDDEVVQRWVPTMTQLIMSSQHLRQIAQFRPETVQSRVETVRGVKHDLWVMSEYAGRERAIIGQAISKGEPIASKRLRTLSEYRGRLEQAWAAVSSYRELDSASPRIVDAIDGVESKFFDAYGRTRQKVYQAGIAGTAYPMSADEWIAAATEAIDSLLAAASETTAVANGLVQQAESRGQRNVVVNAALVIAAALVGAIAFWIAGWRVAGSINRMTTTMTALADGDLSVEVPDIERRDEIGQMAQAVQVFKENSSEAERLRKEQEEAEERSREEKRQAMFALADKFESNVGEIVQAVTSASQQLDATAQSMSSVAEQTTQQSSTVASTTEQSAANVQTVASAAEELSNSIQEISRQVEQSTRMASEAVEQATRTNTQVQNLAQAAEKIGNVITLIQDIAEQTNMLALNATIEAARAGEAGKGFAVVAQEVKGLANQTANATREISEHIDQVQSETQEAVTAIETITSTIKSIDEITTSIASAVEEQGAATAEISRNVQQAATGAQEVTKTIGGVSEAAQETGSAAEQVVQAVGQLSSQSENLRHQMDEFLSEVRAA